MSTRHRGSEPSDSRDSEEPPATRRSARRTPQPSPDLSVREAGITEPNGFLDAQAARRGTRRIGREASVSSVDSNPAKLNGTGIYTSTAYRPNNILSTVNERDEAAGLPSSPLGSRSVASLTPMSAAQKRGFESLLPWRLPKLMNAADDLRQFLSRERREDEDEDEWLFQLNNYRECLDMYRRGFADESVPYINVEGVLEMLNDTSESSRGGKIAAAIIASNNATMLFDILQNLNGCLQDVLEGLDRDFPEEFLPSPRYIRDLAFDTAMDIRTWLFVTKVRDPSHTLDPAELLCRVFGAGDSVTGEGLAKVNSLLQSGPFKPLVSIDFQVEGNDARLGQYCGRIRQIRDVLYEDGGGLNGAEALDNEFPLESFLGRIKEWNQSIFEDLRELESEKTQQDGKQYAAVAREAAADNHPLLSQPSSQSQSQPQNSFDASKIKRLSGSQMGHKFSGEDNINILYYLTYSEISQQDIADSTSTTSTFPLPLDEIRHEADRVRSSQYPGPPRSYQDAIQDMPRKRPRLETASSDNDNDDFQTDSREPDDSKRKRAPLARHLHGPVPPQEEGPKTLGSAVRPMGPPARSDVLVDAVPSPSSSSFSSLPPARPANAYLPPPLPGSSYPRQPNLQALHAKSRAETAVHRKKPTQTRHPWSEADQQRLIAAVGIYEAKWSVIEGLIRDGTIAMDRFRDQQALRDKARLLKTDFLKTDGILPPGFDRVVLAKNYRKAVIETGKNPDRTEEDVLDGEPTNTQYQE